jgi:hypothetical protein
MREAKYYMISFFEKKSRNVSLPMFLITAVIPIMDM